MVVGLFFVFFKVLRGFGVCRFRFYIVFFWFVRVISGFLIFFSILWEGWVDE